MTRTIDLTTLIADLHAARKARNDRLNASNAWEAENNPGFPIGERTDNPHWEALKASIVALRNAEHAIKVATGEDEWPDAARAAGIE